MAMTLLVPASAFMTPALRLPTVNPSCNVASCPCSRPGIAQTFCRGAYLLTSPKRANVLAIRLLIVLIGSRRLQKRARQTGLQPSGLS